MEVYWKRREGSEKGAERGPEPGPWGQEWWKIRRQEVDKA